MASFEVLYGRRCHTPLSWIEPREKVIFGPDIVKEAKAIVHRIQDNLKAQKSHQETYANKEASALRIWSQRSCVLEGLAIERSEEVWGKMKVSSSLYRTIPHPQEVLDCGVQAWPATILSWRSQHLPRVAIEEMFEGTHGRHVAWSDTARGWLIVLGAPNQNPGSEGSCHEV
jgi:hypothetical protein